MLANYHSHTPRCHHAVGDEREYVEEAIKAGIRLLGFSDHSPQFFPGEYVSWIRMLPEELPDYCDAVLKLRDEYKKDIDIRLGLEVEYYPELFDRLCEYVKDYPIEYFLLGQHWIGNEYDQESFYAGKSDDELLKIYVDQCIAAMDTGRFMYIAHPDVFRHEGRPEVYTREYRRLCEHARALDIPLEINLLGLATNRHYPDSRFWHIAADVGNTVILGSDAHAPADVSRPEAEAASLEMIQCEALTLIETLPEPLPRALLQTRFPLP